MRAGDGDREEFRAKLQAHLELKKNKKDAPSRKKLCCSAPIPRRTPFHCGNCGSSSKLFYSLACTIRTSLPSEEDLLIYTELSVSPPTQRKGLLDKWAWITKGNYVSQLPMLSGKRVTNKSKPTGSIFEEN